MAKLNENFFNLKKNYLFIDIGKRVKAYTAAHPEAKLIRMGIGDVTQPLAPVVVDAMVKASKEMGVKETFRGYEDSGAGYDFLREAVSNYYKSFGADVDPAVIHISDVVVFSFTVYGYGADLGVDNSSWGGAPALKEQVKTAELVKLFADNKDLLNGSDEQAYAFTAAGEALAQYESTQEDVDNAVDRLENILGTETLVTEESPSADADAAAEPEATIDAADDGASGEKGSPSTGVEGVAVAVAVVILAGAGIAMSKKQ